MACQRVVLAPSIADGGIATVVTGVNSIVWQVPPLRGRVLTAYSVLWWLLFAAAVAVTGLTVAHSEWDGPNRMPLLRAGINYTRDTAPGLVVFDATTVAARQAGLVRGDRIVAIADGDPDAGLDRASESVDGTMLDFRIRAASGAERTVALPLSDANVEETLRYSGFTGRWMAGWTLVMLLGSTLLTVAASFLLFRKQRTNPVAATLSLVPLILAASSQAVVPFIVSQWAAFVGMTILRIALLAFPDGRFTGHAAKVLIPANIAWLGMATINDRWFENGSYVLFAASIAAVYWRYRHQTSVVERQQMRWAMLGFGIAAVAALGLLICAQLSYVLNDLTSVLLIDMVSDVFDTTYVSAVWGGLLIALLRYRLYDADVAITRSAVWVVSAPLLAFLFGSLVEVLKVLAGPLFGNDYVATPVAGVITAMTIQPVSSWIERRIEAWSRRDLLALKHDVPAAARDLQEDDDRSHLLAYVCGKVRPALRAQTVAIVIGEDDHWTVGYRSGGEDDAMRQWLTDYPRSHDASAIEIDRGDRLFPLRVPLIARPAGEAEAIAWLLVGPRPDGSVQDRDARETLGEIGPEIGRALHVIAARRRRNQVIIDVLTKRLAAS